MAKATTPARVGSWRPRFRPSLVRPAAVTRPSRPSAPESATDFGHSIATTAALCLLALAIVRVGWVSDDAFIALRAADNLATGNGLVSNPPERVQAFTSPLWTLVLAGCRAIHLEPYAALIVPALVCSLAAALWLAFRIAATPAAGAVALVTLALSTSFTEYSTSGLENPLSHLLLAGFLTQLGGRSTRTPWVLGGLIALCRMDLVIVIAPALLILAIEQVRAEFQSAAAPGAALFSPSSALRAAAPVARRAATGGAPFVAWLAFSVFYYGSPFPNTAYAKLNLDVPRLQMVGQGFAYLLDSVVRDPLTLLVIGAGCSAALRVGDWSARAVACGVLGYLAYVVVIGGDFMSGRFLSVPLFVVVALVARNVAPLISAPSGRALAASIALVGLLFPGALAPHNNLDCRVAETGIVDERACYAGHTALPLNLKSARYRDHDYFKKGLEYASKHNSPIVSKLVGMTGFAAGPAVHLVDPYALTDPLLARIPFHPKGRWRVGHFERPLPAGYVETLRSGHNRLKSPCLRRYYDALSPVIRGPLFNLQRLRRIWELGIGRYDDLLDPDCDRRNSRQSRRPKH